MTAWYFSVPASSFFRLTRLSPSSISAAVLTISSIRFWISEIIASLDCLVSRYPSDMLTIRRTAMTSSIVFLVRFDFFTAALPFLMSFSPVSVAYVRMLPMMPVPKNAGKAYKQNLTYFLAGVCLFNCLPALFSAQQCVRLFASVDIF